MDKRGEQHPYSDILDLPYPPPGRPCGVSMQDRAAQFAPFAALTGYEAVIDETGRQTQRRREPDEEEKSRLDRRLALLESCLGDMPSVTFTCFHPDERKEGGSYVRITGIVKKIDRASGCIVLQNGAMAAAEDIVDIEGEIFSFMEDEEKGTVCR